MGRFTQSLQNAPQAIGTIITLDAVETVEAITQAGVDWIFIDAEHAPLSAQSVQRILIAKAKNCHALVRLPKNEASCIHQALDSGADGVIIPQVNTKEEAIAAVTAAKYPPIGMRSVGIARAHGYGQDFSSYVENANAQTDVILQIEHIDSVTNIEEILSTKGVDGIFIGPYDLSASMERTGQVDHPDVLECISHIKEAACKRRIPVGLFAANTAAAKKQPDIDFIAVGTDILFLANAVQTLIKDLK